MSMFRRLFDDRSGNAIAIGAALIVPLVALVGAALDLSVAYTTRTKLQNACDAAVIAGRQSMDGSNFQNRDRQEAENYFEFNFPEGTFRSREVTFEIEQNEDDELELLGTASAVQPTALMVIFGYDSVELSVNCNARRDQFESDIVLVLDVTGSMSNKPSFGGGVPKIDLLRDGANGLYRALDGESIGTIRYGIVPYSHTVNPARSLQNRDILREQIYVSGSGGEVEVNINESQWNKGKGGGDSGGNTQNFRTSGIGCIEERPSVGEDDEPAEYNENVTLADIDATPKSANDTERQFGRYDPKAHEYTKTGFANRMVTYTINGRDIQTNCPAEATMLQTYETEKDFGDAIAAATTEVAGYTYHDIGMIWGMRFISRNGFFSKTNPTERNGVTVNQHIIFMTDGKLQTTTNVYSAYGIERFQDRTNGSGNLSRFHLNRFEAACDLARQMNITVWVIALDVTDTDDIEPCATSSEYFYTSDGSDLEEVFTAIGNGIGYLRLTT